jgi:hypothetical protein
MTRYYEDAFAVTGDRTTIPNDTQPSGSVSYEQGFGPDYQKDLATEPSAKPFPRDQYNQFCYDVTDNLQGYQQWGAPLFIPSMTSAPATFPYAVGVIVRYDDGGGDKLYQSIVPNNTELPTDTLSWQEVSIVDNSFYIYTDNFDPGVDDGDVVAFSSVTETFEQAIAGNAILENAIGVAEPSKNRIQILGISTLFSGLTPGVEYFLSSSSAGAITTVASSGVTQVIFGYAISSAQLLIRVQKEITPTAKYGIVTFGATTTQSLPTGINPIQFDNVQYDPFEWWDAGGFQWKPSIQGVFQFNAAVFGDVTYASTQGIALYKNGALAYWLNEMHNTAAASMIVGNGSPPIPMNGTTDFVQLVWQNQPGGTATTIGAQSGANGDKSFFSIQLMGL